MTDPLDEQSWAFALRLYAEPDVAVCCLRLQDEAGVDVMLLLAVASACRRGLALTPSDLGELANVCRPWREQIVHPLRAVRVALKSEPPPAPNAAGETLRNHIKAAELQAERLQNDLLATWLQRKGGVLRAVTLEELHSALRSVVVLALPEQNRICDLTPAIDTIAAAAARVAA